MQMLGLVVAIRTRQCNCICYGTQKQRQHHH